MKHTQLPLALGLSLVAAMAPLSAYAGKKGDTQPYISLQVNAEAQDLTWLVNGEWHSATLKISNTEVDFETLNFKSGETIKFSTVDSLGIPLTDGIYTWELAVMKTAPGSRDSSLATENTITSGAFSIVNGKFLVPTDTGVDSDNPDVTKDVVHVEDTIIQGSLGLGFDAVNGENFGFDTLRLKENNLRIHFNDTSNSGSFPSNDWRIVINDTTNGGANYFAVEDSTAGRIPFRIVAGAPVNSLYVDAQGDVGIGTSNPVVKTHIAHGDSPAVRLEQNGSSGFTPQTWDMAGNETNFFIRDVTNGSKLPFRIRPGASENSIYIDTDGDIGMGTNSPGAALHIRRTGGNSGLLVEEASSTKSDRTLLELRNNGGTGLLLNNTDATNGKNWTLRSDDSGDFSVLDDENLSILTLRSLAANAGSSLTLFGNPLTSTNDWSLSAGSSGELQFLSGSTAVATMDSSALNVENTLKFHNGSNVWSNYTDSSGNIVWRKSLPFDLMKLESNGKLTTTGTMNATSFVTTSDVNKKHNIVPVDPVDILNKVVATPISEWSFNFGDTQTRHIGPMAQDFKASFNVGNTDKAINLTDSSGVALAAIQGLNQVIEQKDAEIDELKEKSDRMEKQLELLMKEVQGLKEKK